MSLILRKSAFLHIPKTGGTWVRRMLTDTGLVIRVLMYDDPALTSEHHAPSHHSVIKPEDVPPVVFAFVRHPLTWYRSYWAWNAYSRPTLPLIPRQSCHPSQSKAATDSGESCHPLTG